MKPIPGTIATVVAAASALAGCAAPGPAPGIVTGQFIESGGPATLSGGTPHFPLSGQVVAVNSAGARYSVTVGKDGRFSLSLPAGAYQLAGYSLSYDDGKSGCPSSAGQRVQVATGRTTHGVLVICVAT